jgi:hypothetical protein
VVEYASSRLQDERLLAALAENERQRNELRAHALRPPCVSVRELGEEVLTGKSCLPVSAGPGGQLEARGASRPLFPEEGSGGSGSD